MKIEVEPTNEIELVEGTHCRVWNGKTALGTHVRLLVAMVQAPSAEDQQELEDALKEVPSTRQMVYIDNRMVL